MNQQSNLALAKQGDRQAIAYVVSYFLKDKGIKAQANIQNTCLFLVLESATPLEKISTIHTIRELLNKLAIPQVKTVKIQSKLEGVTKADWLGDIKLVIAKQSSPNKSQSKSPLEEKVEKKAIDPQPPNSAQKQLLESPENQTNNQQTATNIFLTPSNWSPWFPYPNSWLRTLGLITGLFVIFRIIMYWNGRLFRWNPTAAGSIVLVTLIILFTYIHHIVFAKETPNFKVILPTPRSWWEGIYAAIVYIVASLVCIIIILPFILVPNCDLLSSEFTRLCLRSIDGYYYSHRYRYVQALFMVGFIIWVFISAYLYQIEFLIRKNFSMQKFVKILLIGFITFSLSILASFTIRNYQPIQSFLQSIITENIEKISLVFPSPLVSNPPVSSITSTTSPVTSTTTLSPPPLVPSITSQLTNSPIQADPFASGTENAKQASKLVQVAKTKVEWQKVVEHWASAVTFMQAVPTSHPKHTIAQKKVLEYQANLDYAKRAGNLAVN